MTTHFTSFVAVYLLLRQGNQVLLHLRQGTGYKDGSYSLIAGHLDGNESAKAAMVREAREEAGIVVHEDDLDFGCVMHRKSPDREYIDIYYVCTHWDGTPTNTEPHKCGGLHFKAVDDLPSNIVDYVATAICAVEKGENYIEFGWNT